MTTATITPNQRLQVVKHLAGGKSLDLTASIIGLTREVVLDIGSRHGYPHKDKMARAAEILTRKLEDENADEQITQGTSIPEGARTLPGSTPSASNGGASSITVNVPRASGLEGLIAAGRSHPAKRIQAAANKVMDDINRLRSLINEDTEKNAERRKADAEKAEARAEVERLKKALAEAQAKLRGPKPPATPAAASSEDGPSSKEVRTWAAANDVECPSRGSVPSSVREAYDAAHLQEAS